jgi:hypothetical protein
MEDNSRRELGIMKWDLTFCDFRDSGYKCAEIFNGDARVTVVEPFEGERLLSKKQEEYAALIAAAPELLAVLEAIVEVAEAQKKAGDRITTLGSEYIRSVRAAISKAKGE